MTNIASAVVLPDEDGGSPQPTAAGPTPLSPKGIKRRQSSVSAQATKRARVDGDESPNARRGSASSTKGPAVELKGRERGGRERRLFGAALGALARNTTTAGDKRRLEIEKRQRERRKQEEEENEQRRQERRVRREAQRWREQRQLDEDNLRTRHDNLLSRARFLQTRTEPRLYYMPWETSPEEDERIRQQVAEAHDTIRREREDFDKAKRRYDERERDAPRGVHMDDDAEGTHSGKEQSATDPLEPSAANGHPTNGTSLSKNPEQNEDHAQTRADMESTLRQDASNEHERSIDDTLKDVMDEQGEEVVEAAEDTIMY